jgi:hypothetical protein
MEMELHRYIVIHFYSINYHLFPWEFGSNFKVRLVRTGKLIMGKKGKGVAVGLCQLWLVEVGLGKHETGQQQNQLCMMRRENRGDWDIKKTRIPNFMNRKHSSINLSLYFTYAFY